MIEGFDIKNFGSFRDFQWNSVRDTPGNNIARFKRLNLLYGRNCSGKTTLSRILRCLETGELPQKYTGPVFNVLSGERSIAQDQIPSTKHAIRVYNRDFVEKHLAFLRHDDGTIEPFATIGLKNKEIEQAIAEKIDRLGSIESKAGLVHEREQAVAARDRAQHAASTADQSLDAVLTKKAASPPDGMKYKSKFGDINYNKAKLRADISWVMIENVQPLGDDSVRDLEALIGEAALAPIAQRLDFTARLPSIYAAAKELLARKIEPTQPIQELLNDAVLQSWVREGIVHHRDKRTTCGYCRQPLPADLWEQLNAHFNKQSVDLDRDISDHLKRISAEEAAMAAIGRVDRSLVYSQLRERLAILTSELESELAKYRNSLAVLASSLQARAGSIFSVQAQPSIEDNSAVIAEWVADINSLISESDAKTVSLEADKKRAMTRLRLSEVARFAVDINFESIEATNAGLRHEASLLADLASDADADVRKVEAEVRQLREQLRDERRGAERINEFLMKHFGHQALRLEAVEEQDTKRFRFRIFRGNELAYNLSEGECSLVAFCYFLAKLEDADTHDKSPIVWIDDPISSLDSNHIFFVFSLIESQLARPVKGSTGKPSYRYEQLFISTHNLEFLKYLGRLSGPPNKSKQHYIVAQRDGRSVVECMPLHLKQYSTEFNYLFGEIHTCTNAANDAHHHHCFYGFGNNLRRFLEAYLFFKYPTTDGGSEAHDKRIVRFFGGEISTEVLVQRLMNEYSHLGMFDRSMQPIDCDEIARVARFVLSKIKSSDPEQYACLLESIDKSDPL